MENLLLTIPHLMQKQNFGGSNQGLLNGNTGMAIYLYHISREMNNPEYEEMADNLLDKIFACITTSVPPDFENGLAGIGWGIEYLVKNGFAKGDPDEILEEVDTKVYITLCNGNLNAFELTNGLTGYLLYLNSRLKNTANQHSMVYSINKELLILAVNKLDELFAGQFSTIVKEPYFDLFWRFPLILHALTETYNLNIYNRKIERMVKQWVMHLEAYIPSLHINRLFMALALTQLNAIIPNRRIEKQIHILLFATNFEEMETEFDPNHQGIRFGWPGAIWLLYMAKRYFSPQMPNYNLIVKTHNEYVTRFKSKLDNEKHLSPDSVNLINPGISDGITGIGLMVLMYPDVFCHEYSEITTC